MLMAKPKAEMTVDQYQGVRMTDHYGMGTPHVSIPIESFTREPTEGDEVRLVAKLGAGQGQRLMQARGVVTRIMVEVEVLEYDQPSEDDGA